jgi:hypothetical protein
MSTQELKTKCFFSLEIWKFLGFVKGVALLDFIDYLRWFFLLCANIAVHYSLQLLKNVIFCEVKLRNSFLKTTFY